MKNKVNTKVVIIIVIIAVVVALAIFLSHQKKSNSYIYRGPSGTYEVYNTNEGGVDVSYIKIYVNTANSTIKVNVPLRFDPKSVENIPLDNVKDKVFKQLIYLTQSPSLPDLTDRGSIIASLEVSKITGMGIYRISTQTAITEPSATSKLPVVTCNDVNETVAVINFRFGEPSIKLENDCIIIQGNDKNSIIKAADKFIMHLFGVF
ncbi:MAG: hypothetical protein AABY07_06475 [Nanoarchaeota archaeon]